MESESSRDLRTWYVLLSALVLAAFLPSLMTGFVFDDLALIVENPYAQSLTYLERCFRTDLWDVPTRSDAERWSLFYRPVVTSSYVLNWVATGGAAWTFHLVNVLAHLGAVLLAFRTATRWTGDYRLGFAAAVIFGLHPTRNESVLWVSGRTDVLMGLFVLLALELCSSASSRRGYRAALMWTTAVAAWVLAVLSKEYAVLFPVLVGAEAWLTDQSSTRRRKLLFGTAGALILSAAYLWLRAHHMPLRPPGIDGDHIPLLFHAQYVLLTVGRYVERMILPWPQVLTIRPIYLEQGQVVLPTSDVVIGVLACLAFGIISVWSALRQRRLLVLLLCSFALFLPISNVVYSGLNSTTADRFFYFPMFGAALTVAAFARPLLGKARKVSLMVLAGGGVALFIGVAWVRTLDFVSEDTFWAQEAAVNPNNPVALIALAELAHRSGDRQLYRRHLLNAYSQLARSTFLLRRPLGPT